MSLLSPSLEAFWNVARTRTVQDASKKLGLTQTGVTQRIRSLEKHLRVTLFVRSRTGMNLTREGEILLRLIESYVELEGVALAQIKNTARTNNIEIGISGPSSIMRSRVIPTLLSKDFKKNWPWLRFKFDLCDNDEVILRKMKSGEKTFGIVDSSLRVNEMKSLPLSPEIYFLACSRETKKTFQRWERKKSLLDLCFLENERLLSIEAEVLEKHCLQKSHFHEVCTLSDSLSRIEQISNNSNLGIISTDQLKNLKASHSIVALDPKISFAKKWKLLWYPREFMPDYMQALIKTL